MTEIKKSSDVYGGSLGLHTTVNIGVKLLKPEHPQLASGPFLVGALGQLTSNW